jgi:hypothetical protein
MKKNNNSNIFEQKSGDEKTTIKTGSILKIHKSKNKLNSKHNEKINPNCHNFIYFL